MTKGLAIGNTMANGKKRDGKRAAWRHWLAGLVVSGSLFAISPLAAEEVGLRAWDHQGYGRIVFEWQTNTGFSAEIQGDELVLNFTNAMEADFGPVLQNLNRYVQSADIGSSGQTAILRLKGPFDLKTFAAGRRIVVDLVDRADSFDATPAPQTETTAGREQVPANTAPRNLAAESQGNVAATQGPLIASDLADLDTILIRTGRHPTYERLVFDWRKSVQYDVSREGNRVDIRFKDKAKPDFSQFERGRTRMIGVPSAALQQDELVVSFNVPEGVRLRNQKVGTKVVVDVIGDANAPAVRDFAARRDIAPQIQGLDPQVVQTETATKPVTNAPDEQTTEVTPSPEQEQEIVDGAAPDETPAPDVSESGGEAPETAPVPAVDLVAQEISMAEGDVYGPVPEDLVADQSFRVELDLVPGGVQAIFTWEQPVLASVFQRSGYTWVTFNEEGRAVMPRAEKEMLPFVRRMEQIKTENNVGTALRLAVRSDLFPTVAKEGNIWRVTFRADGGRPASTIQVVSDPLGKDGARVVMPSKDVANRVDFVDPEVGDRLETVPVGLPGQGIADRREFIEFSVLPTVQGIAILPRTDDLNVQPSAAGVQISTDTGLFLSRLEGDDVEILEGDKFPAIEGEFYKYRSWMRGREDDYEQERYALLAELARVPQRVRNTARKELAFFYFAHGLPEHAIGYLRMMEQDDETLALGQDMRGVHGAVLYELNRPEEALKKLSQRSLDGNEEVAMFRGLSHAALGEWDKALSNLQAADPSIDTFPQDLRIAARLALAEASLKMGDPQAVEPLVKLVKGETLPPRESQVAWADYLNAMALVQREKKFRGMELLELLADGDDRKAAAYARFAHIVQQAEDEDITREEAIDRLETLKFTWRGGDYELTLLDKLADIYFETGNYRAGLLTLQDAVGNFPNHPRTKEMAGRMNEVFADLYLGGAADQLPPVKALGLFQDFRELVPLGNDGDRMTRALADRMVGVDLLDQAARLLRSLIDFRLKDEERSRAGSELALIHVLNRDPESALRALRATELDGLPLDLIEQRNYFRVQAMKDLKRYDTALELLGTSESREANQLRAGIYWESQDWVNSVRALNILLDNAWRDEVPLTSTQRKMVLQMAIALNLAQNRDGLELLRSRYGPRMEGTTDDERFRTHTEVIDPSQLEYRDLAPKIAGIGQLEAFMSDFRKKLREGGLDAIAGDNPPAPTPVGDAADGDAAADEGTN